MIAAITTRLCAASWLCPRLHSIIQCRAEVLRRQVCAKAALNLQCGFVVPRYTATQLTAPVDISKPQLDSIHATTNITIPSVSSSCQNCKRSLQDKNYISHSLKNKFFNTASRKQNCTDPSETCFYKVICVPKCKSVSPQNNSYSYIIGNLQLF